MRHERARGALDLFALRAEHFDAGKEAFFEVIARIDKAPLPGRKDDGKLVAILSIF